MINASPDNFEFTDSFSFLLYAMMNQGYRASILKLRLKPYPFVSLSLSASLSIYLLISLSLSRDSIDKTIEDGGCSDPTFCQERLELRLC